MNETPVEALGPAPFRFKPSQGPSIEGPAFSWAFKALVTAVVFGMALWFFQLWTAGKVTGGAVSIMTWFLAALAMIVYTWWCMVRSRTTLDAQSIRQTWMWQKKMDLRDLAYAKLIRVRGLEWLIAPRLYVRTLMGKFAVFHAADPRMLAEFERLVAELKVFRAM